MNPDRLLPAFAKGYRLDLHDYGGDRGAGLLVSSGAGSMMAIMDHAPKLRWCLDIDHLSREGRLAGLLACAAHLPEVLVAFAGWFSITNPKPLLRRHRGRPAQSPGPVARLCPRAPVSRRKQSRHPRTIPRCPEDLAASVVNPSG